MTSCSRFVLHRAWVDAPSDIDRQPMATGLADGAMDTGAALPIRQSIFTLPLASCVEHGPKPKKNGSVAMKPFGASPKKQTSSTPPFDALSEANKEQLPTRVVPSAVVMLHVPNGIVSWCSLWSTVASPPVNSSCTFVTGSLALHLPKTSAASGPAFVPLKSKLNFNPPLLKTAT